MSCGIWEKSTEGSERSCNTLIAIGGNEGTRANRSGICAEGIDWAKAVSVLLIGSRFPALTHLFRSGGHNIPPLQCGALLCNLYRRVTLALTASNLLPREYAFSLRRTSCNLGRDDVLRPNQASTLVPVPRLTNAGCTACCACKSQAQEVADCCIDRGKRRCFLLYVEAVSAGRSSCCRHPNSNREGDDGFSGRVGTHHGTDFGKELRSYSRPAASGTGRQPANAD